MERMRIGIVGTGMMAAVMAGLVRAHPQTRVARVLSSDPDRAAAFAARFGAETGASDPEYFLREGLDAVYVAGTNRQHGPIAQACLAAKLPVLVEKPLCTTAEETVALCAAAREANTLLVENLWTLALPAVRALKHAAETGQYGAARSLQFDFSAPVTPEALPGIFDLEGGGVLRDRGVYGIALALHLMGEVADMDVQLSLGTGGLDVAAALLLGHDGDATSLVTVALNHCGPNRATLSCERAALSLAPSSLVADRLDIEAAAATAGRRDPLAGPGTATALTGYLKRNAALRRLRQTIRRRPGRRLDYGPSPYRPMLDHFVHAVLAGERESALVSHALSVSVAKLVARARRSSE